MPPLKYEQQTLFPTEENTKQKNTSTFVNNMSLPVHRWFRYSAGFSAAWAESVIEQFANKGPTRVLDPFAGSDTTLLAAENVGVECHGVEAHPFITRIAKAKLARRCDPRSYLDFARTVLQTAQSLPSGDIENYPALVRKCFAKDILIDLDRLQRAFGNLNDDSPPAQLTWLTLMSILRSCSHVGTAQWQYILPKKSKKNTLQPFPAFETLALDVIYKDMVLSQEIDGPAARLVSTDARACEGIADDFANLVLTSPPYPNNYDYADATRLEMSFLKEIEGWGDLHNAVRQYLIRSCSQHVPQKAVDGESVLTSSLLMPIQQPLSKVFEQLAKIRLGKGGKKTYHLMVVCYFLDMANVLKTLRRVCQTPCRMCLVIGDSAPYGIYVPVMDWLGQLALDVGFSDFQFTKLRDRNVKWKNRKHDVPLCEGELWITG